MAEADEAHKENIEELGAQVEDHGPEALRFYLDDDMKTPLFLTDVRFEDGNITVLMSP